ncbi:MAG: transposase [Bacilli bacterium]|nr:transposase [Bacilli bacterium]
MHKKSDKGLYVYAEKKYNQFTQKMIEYAVRYTGKPAMAESRILDYDGEYVTFWYQRHKDDQIVKERIHVYDFFKRLIIHIPNENFKTVRYYGIYSKKHKFHDIMNMLVISQTHKLRNSLNTWRLMILKDLDVDPLTCPKCGNQMLWQYRVC